MLQKCIQKFANKPPKFSQLAKNVKNNSLFFFASYPKNEIRGLFHVKLQNLEPSVQNPAKWQKCEKQYFIFFVLRFIYRKMELGAYFTWDYKIWKQASKIQPNGKKCEKQYFIFFCATLYIQENGIRGLFHVGL